MLHLPADRAQWSPESLGKCFAAFVDVRIGAERNQVLATPLLPVDEIVAFGLRDVKIEDDERERFQELLLQQCNDIVEVIPHVHVYVRGGSSTEVPTSSGARNDDVHAGVIGRFFFRPAHAVAGFGKVVAERAARKTETVVSTAREYALQQKVAGANARALRAGGSFHQRDSPSTRASSFRRKGN